MKTNRRYHIYTVTNKMVFRKAFVVFACLVTLVVHCSAKWVLLESDEDEIGIITSDDHSAKKGEKKSGWSYGDLEGWPDVSQTCAATSTSRQSPIDIVESNAVDSTNSIYLTPQNTYETIVNNGHTAKVTLENTLMFTENEQSNSFRVMQLHFHWGSIDSSGKVVGGSEHTVNGKRFAAEMHIVHANNKYPSNPITKLLEQKDGLLVIGIFIEIGDQPNGEMQKIVDALGDIANEGQSSNLMGLSLGRLLPSTLSQSFYHYEGSLTTPPCSETALWILPKEHIKISMQQFEAFQKLSGEHGPIHGNHRPTQALNGRTIYYHGN